MVLRGRVNRERIQRDLAETRVYRGTTDRTEP